MKKICDSQAFAQAKQSVLSENHLSTGIGTLGEKSLHAVLKHYYQPDENLHERKIGKMAVDAILPDGSVLEIQTRNFISLRKKLPLLLACGHVQISAPVVQKKWICWLHPETGEIVSRRRSPKIYAPIDLARELNYIREFLSHPNLSVRFPLLEAEEYRLLDGWGNGGKRGSTRYERIPLALLDEWIMESPSDFAALLPNSLPEAFTVRDLQKSARISSACAYAASAVFRHLNLIEECGTSGRSKCYRKIP